MPPIDSRIWGPHVWNFIHTLVEKIKDDMYKDIHEKVFYYIKQICYNLSCPVCRRHATIYINKLNNDNIKTKEEFIDVLFDFHNFVNLGKNKSIFLKSDLSIYKNESLQKAYDNFLTYYKPIFYLRENGPVYKKLQLVIEFEKWFEENKSSFDFL